MERDVINPSDYEKMPKLRTFLTPKMREVLEDGRILDGINTSVKNKRRYVIGERSLPLKYISENPDALSKIMALNPIFITHGGTKVILPKRINKDIAYLAGLICGDGNLFISKKRDYVVSVHNTNKKLLEKALKVLEENFNYRTAIKEGHECQMIEVRSEVIHSFFS